MDLNEYQRRSQKTAIYSHVLKTIDGLTYSILALCGEAGELANKLKKAHRAGTEPDSAVLADELGDCLWYVASVAHELGLTLEEVAALNLEKLALRSASGSLNLTIREAGLASLARSSASGDVSPSCQEPAEGIPA